MTAYEYAVLKSAFEGKLTTVWRENNPMHSALDFLNKAAGERKQVFDETVRNKEKVKNNKINHDFEFKINEKISSWAVAKLDKLISISARVGWKGLKKEEYTSEGPLFISVHSLNYGKNVSFNDAYHITEERYEESPDIKLKLNDILLCKDGAGIGKIGIVKHLPSEATVNSSILIIRGEEIFIADFLYYLFKGPQMQKIVIERVSGSAIPHLFQKDIKEFVLNVPPIEEQKQIVQEIEYRLTIVENLKIAIKENQARAKILKRTILDKAFSGKLTSQDKNETATGLIEKISSEKSVYNKMQLDISKAKPRKIKAMDEKKSILQILSSSTKAISAKDAWLQSKHRDDIEGFYLELREIQDKIVEIKNETESLLSLRHED